MPKKIEFTLTKDEITQVKQAIKRDKRPEVRQRAMAIRMLGEGQRPSEVAEFLSVTMPSIYGWWQRWKEGGIDGLANKPHKPGKRKAVAAYRQALDEALNKEPSEYGYNFAIWTRERLRDHLKQETGVKLSINWLGEVMKAEGYEYRRPKHDLTHLQNQTEKELAKELLDELKKTSSQTISSSSLWTKRP
jgi:transposase